MVSLAVPALAAPAEAPEWNEGDRWAYGMEVDVDEALQQELENLTMMIDQFLSDIDGIEADLNDLNMAASSEAWILFEVTEANNEVYVLSMDMAAMVSINADISITAELPAEGTYDLDELINAERDPVTMSAGLDFTMILTVSVDITFDRETMALKSVESTLKLTVSMDLTAENLPLWLPELMNGDYNESLGGEIEVEYTDYDISADLEFNLAIDLEFVPALNLWDFPLDEGDEWNVSSNATVSGSMSGFLDVSGLPAEMEDALFMAISGDTGIDSFPIIFEDLDLGDFPFDGGVMEETTEHIGPIHLKCTDMFVVDDPYWNDITVYEINVVGTPLRFFYSPNVGFMSYFSMSMDEISDEMPDGEVRMEAVDPDVAEDNIAEISERQGGVEEEGGTLGFFTDPPYLGIILVAVIVVVVVAAVFLIRKK
jgi:hypothetical protein